MSPATNAGPAASMPTLTATAATTDGPANASLGQLVSAASKDLSALVHDEIALAKAELRRDVATAASGAALFAGAAVCALFALIMLCFAAAHGIHNLGLGLAWSYLLVAAVFLLVTLVTAVLGKALMGRIGGTKKSVRSMREAVGVLRRRPPAPAADSRPSA
jgi:hypothetical protein